uniref:uncharacterized protein LOC120341436 n=1 Tax=Styela clava TaxID=7725 RepID=UPI00193A4AF3|nr:uncharacterized protein LOC120341436 [Styela clava]
MEIPLKLSTLFAFVFFQIVCSQQCEIPKESLQIRHRIGQLKPKNYPQRISAKQNCVWQFSDDIFPGQALFIYVSGINLVLNNEAIADITIGEENPIYEKPRANCRLYGKNITDLNWINVNKYFIENYERKGKSCNAWFVDSRPVQKVVFRSFGVQNEPFPFKEFMLVYEYLPVESILQSDTTTVKNETFSTHFTSLGMSSPGVTTKDYEKMTDKVQCGNNTAYIVLIVLLALCLFIIISYFIYHISRQRSARQKGVLSSVSSPRIHVTASSTDTGVRMENAPDSTNPNTDIVLSGNDNHAYAMAVDPFGMPITSRPSENINATSTYATIGNTVATGSNFPIPSDNGPMYDIPTNNRERAPTAISSTSNPTDPYYQIPSGRIPDKNPPSSNVKDVYAIVRKDK